MTTDEERSTVGDGFLAVAVELLRRFPGGALPTVAGALGDLTWDVINLRRDVVMNNLERAMPELSMDERNRLARRCYRFCVEAVLDWVRLPKGLEEFNLEVKGLRNLEPYVGGSGAILVGAHLGYWEWSAAILSRRFDGITVYADRQSVDVFQRFIHRHRLSYGVRGAYGSLGVRHLLRAVNRGGLVGVVGDQRPRSRYEYVKFMDREVRNMTIFSYLAEKTGAPVIPVVAWRTARGRVRLEVDEPLPSSTGESVDPPGLLREFNAWLEDAIVQYPEQYFWLHNRFKHDRPVGKGKEPSGG